MEYQVPAKIFHFSKFQFSLIVNRVEHGIEISSLVIVLPSFCFMFALSD